MADKLKEVETTADSTNRKVVSIVDANKRFANELDDVAKKGSRLLTMHQHPDDYDFGTGHTNQAIAIVAAEVKSTNELVREAAMASREATTSLKELTGVIRLSLQATGRIVPDKGDT